MNRSIFKLDPPGALLAQTLEELGISQYRFARRSGIDRALVNGICKGTRRITAESAIRIARALGTDARSWLNLQAKYDLWKAEENESVYAAIEPFPEALAR